VAKDAEVQACTPSPVNPDGFNPDAALPFGLTIAHVRQAMEEFVAFVGFINPKLHTRRLPRLELILAPATFSGMVGDYVVAGIPKYCAGLAKNWYHNGHPDLLPAGKYAGDSIQYGDAGIEVKASRYSRGWQGHNAENCWLMVFVFDSNRPLDSRQGNPPRPFRFLQVVGAELAKEDWKEQPRGKGKRRTPTASVLQSGYKKMMANWIYNDRPPQVARKGAGTVKVTGARRRGGNSSQRLFSFD
jgi:hypothetical protein